MAQYQHLPIYKQTYDLLLRTMTATKDFPREYKYTLGQKIKEELIELVVMIYRANSAQDKARHIESILERVQAIQLMMRLSHDMRILSRRHYAALSINRTRHCSPRCHGIKALFMQKTGSACRSAI